MDNQIFVVAMEQIIEALKASFSYHIFLPPSLLRK